MTRRECVAKIEERLKSHNQKVLHADASDLVEDVDLDGEERQQEIDMLVSMGLSGAGSSAIHKPRKVSAAEREKEVRDNAKHAEKLKVIERKCDLLEKLVNHKEREAPCPSISILKWKTQKPDADDDEFGLLLKLSSLDENGL